MSRGVTLAVFYPLISLANIKTKGFTSQKSFCRSGSQTLFFGGREATTGNPPTGYPPPTLPGPCSQAASFKQFIDYCLCLQEGAFIRYTCYFTISAVHYSCNLVHYIPYKWKKRNNKRCLHLASFKKRVFEPQKQPTFWFCILPLISIFGNFQ